MKSNFSLWYLFASILFHLSILAFFTFWVPSSAISPLIKTSEVDSQFHVELNRIAAPKLVRQKSPRVQKKKVSAPTEPKVEVTSLEEVKKSSMLKKQMGEKKISSYAEQLKVYLEQNKVYPRSALKLGHSGVVKLRLQIFNNGEFGAIDLVDPSHFNTLNKAAVNLLKKLKKFKPLPSAEGSKDFIIPISYNLKGRR